MPPSLPSATCSPLPVFRRHAGALLPLLCLPLALVACNESSSTKLDTAALVLAGELVASGSNVQMKVNMGKEGSTVVVVLEGGDALRAGDGSSEVHMDYTADIFGSHYRAAFPLNMAASYSATLVRADGSRVASVFPALPNAFSITSPVNAQAVVLSATPTIDVAWDVVVNSADLALDSSLACSWTVTPMPAGTVGAYINRVSGDYRVLNSGERNQRRAAINLFVMADLQRAQLAADNPGSTVSLHACDAGLRVYARNFGPANNALSRYSQMNTRRSASVSINVTP